MLINSIKIITIVLFSLLASTAAQAKGLDEIELSWQQLTSAIIEKNPNLIESAADRLNNARLKAGYKSLSSYSLQLIDSAANYKDTPLEAMIVAIALKISPENQKVIYKAKDYVKGESLKNLSEYILKKVSISSLLSSSFILLIYPILFSLTFAIILTSAYIIVCQPAEIFYPIQRFFKSKTVWPIIVWMLLLVIAIILGPLATLILLSFTVFRKVPWILFLSGSLMVVWGLIIPLLENSRRLILDPDFQAVYRTVNLDYGRDDLDKLSLIYSYRNNDPLVLAAYAIKLRQAGENKEAIKILSELSAVSGDSLWLKIQQGMVQYLLNDFKAAKNSFKEAADQGDATGHFLLSKILFEQLDTESSRKHYLMAKEIDEKLVNKLEVYEDIFLEDQSGLGIDYNMPVNYFVKSLLAPKIESIKNAPQKIKPLFYQLSSLHLVIFGALMMTFFIFIGSENKKTCYLHNRSGVRVISLFPGGLMVIVSKPLLAIIPTSAMFILGFIFMDWPYDLKITLSLFNEGPNLLFVLSTSIILFFYTLGFYLYKNKRGV